MDTVPGDNMPLTAAQRELRAFYSDRHFERGEGYGILSGVVLDSLARFVLRVRELSFVTSILASFVLTGVLALFHVALQTVLAPGAPLLPGAMVMICAIAAWAALTVQMGPSLGFPPIAENLPQILIDEAEVASMVAWSRRAFDLRRQLIFAVAWASLLFGLTYAYFPLTAPALRGEDRLAFSIMHGIANFFGGNAFYWAMHYPNLWRQVGSAKLRLSRFNPSATPELHALGTVANVYVVVASLFLTAYIVWLNFVAVPLETATGSIVSLGMTVLIVVALAYIFLEPHRHLARAILRQKAETTRYLEGILEGALGDEDLPEVDELLRVNALLELSQKVERTPSTVLSRRSIRSLFMSLVLPVVTFLADIIID